MGRMLLIVAVLVTILCQCTAFTTFSHSNGVRIGSLYAKKKAISKTVTEYVVSREERNYETLKSNPFKYKYLERDEVSQMLEGDVARGDNFWSATYPKTKKRRLTATQQSNMQERLDTDKNFINLMNTGYDRRYLGEHEGTPEEQAQRMLSPSSPATILKDAAEASSAHLELRISKEDQLKELQRKQLLSRTGPLRLMPQPTHKYFDYITSLRKDPGSPGEVRRNMLVAMVFAFITMSNARARMAFMYVMIGNVAIMSILLARNMPQKKVPMGMARNKVVNWSKSAFQSAVAVTGLLSLLSGGVYLALLNLLPLKLVMDFKLRLAMALSLLTTGLGTSFFEVYEEKSKDGWRWQRSREGFLPEDIQAKLKEQVFGSGAEEEMTEMYDYDYDPQIDDYPPLPRFLDEVDGSGGLEAIMAGGAGELDEAESAVHYGAWMDARRDARKAPILDAESDDKWVGGKAGLFVDPEKVPGWLTKAYRKNVTLSNRWRDKPAKYLKDTKEFDPIQGPMGHRDKRPEWLNEHFGGGIWEEKLSVSRKAARAFGSYRKTMWKVDKEVVLQPCDGADKDPHAAK